MSKFIKIFLVFLLFFSIFSYHDNLSILKGEETHLYQIGIIGLMPDDYIGAFSLHTANTYESDYKSDLAFPMQGMISTPDGNIAVCDTSYGRIHVLNTKLQNVYTFGELGMGSGKLQYPADIAIDSEGNYFVADFFNNYWAKFDKSGKWILNAGTEGKEEGQFNGPSGIAVDNKGNVFVSDHLNGRIQVFDKEGKFKSVLKTEVKGPGGMHVDSSGNLFVVDMRNNVVFKLDESGKTLLKIGSSGTGDGQFIYPFDVLVDKEGNIYVLDRGLGKTKHAVIQKFDSTGKFISKIGGNASKIPQPDGTFITPGGFTIDEEGNVYVIDSGYFYSPGNPFGYPIGVRLSKFNSKGDFILKKDYDVNENGRLMNPWSACEDSNKNIWVTSWTNFSDVGEVDVYTAEGRFIKSIKGINEKEPFKTIGGIVSDGFGNIYIALGDYIAKFDEHFNFIAKIGEKKVSNVYGLATDSQGNLWVASNGTQTVVGFKPDGTFISQFSPAHSPTGLYVDKSGNFYITTVDDNKVYIYSSSGKLIKSFGGGGRSIGKFWIPYGIIVDSEGNILVSDTENGRIQAFKGSTYEFLWSTPREFYEPTMLNWTKEGNLLMADCFHNVIRVLSTTPPVTSSYKFEAKTSLTKIELKPGETATFNLIIRNTGETDDSYSLIIENNLPIGWNLSSVVETVEVKAGEQSIIPINIVSSASAKPKDGGKVVITIKSNGDKKLISTLEVSFTIPEAPPVNITLKGDNIPLNQTVAINIVLDKTEFLYGISITLSFDKDLLKVEKVESGGILGSGALFLESHDKPGTIIIGYSLQGKNSGLTAEGIVATITFSGIKEGIGQLQFTEVSLYNSDLQLIRNNPIGMNFEVFNPTPPKLIVNIQDGLTVREQYFSFSGSTDPGCTVTVNGKITTVNQDGTFTATLSLNKGANMITVIATSKYNKSQKITKTIYLNKAIIIILQIGNSTFTVNGESRILDSPPIIKNNRTLLPIRAIVEALGGTVGWDGTTKKVTVSLGSTTIELWIGKSIAKVNGIDIPIDPANSKVVPEIINSRTMLPLRFVTESLGCDVQWDGTTKTITITYTP